MVAKVEFYFLRHGLAAAGSPDPSLKNPEGIAQASKVQKLVASLKFATVFSSPLQRAQQTKKIVMTDQSYRDIIQDRLQENDEAALALWAKEKGEPVNDKQKNAISQFISKISACVDEALMQTAPVLLISHGGVFLAIKKIFQLDIANIEKDESKIMVNNCHLIKISKTAQNTWQVESVEQPLLARL